MKVLVTGGTGFIGRHLVKALLAKGSAVRILSRKRGDVRLFKDTGLEWVCGDLTVKESLQEIARDVDVVFHLAAQMGTWGLDSKHFANVNVQGTQNILEECVDKGVKQFILASTPGVQGKGDPHANETLPFKPPYDYERTKCEAEKLVIKSSRYSDLQVTIIRPDFVYGPGDLRRLSLYRAIKQKKFYIVGSGKSILHPTYVEDLIQGFGLVMNNQVAFGEIYNIAGPHQITVEDYVRVISKALDVPVPLVKIPKPLALAMAMAFEIISKVSGNEPYISRSRIEFLTQSHGLDIDKARTQLGYAPKYDFEEGIRFAISWYRNRGLI